jgi:hypothetical protein
VGFAPTGKPAWSRRTPKAVVRSMEKEQTFSVLFPIAP